MELKVGDKVKLVGNVFWISVDYTGKVGTVTKISPSGSFQYTVEVDAIKIPVDGCEIEKVVTKGEQLLFSFMKQ